MSSFTGIAMLILAGVLYLKYSPKSQNGRVLCTMTGVMGVMALLTGSPSWKVQLIQTALQMVVGFCCFVQLRREKIIRTRRNTASLHVHRPGREAQQKIKTCA